MMLERLKLTAISCRDDHKRGLVPPCEGSLAVVSIASAPAFSFARGFLLMSYLLSHLPIKNIGPPTS